MTKYTHSQKQNYLQQEHYRREYFDLCQALSIGQIYNQFLRKFSITKAKVK